MSIDYQKVLLSTTNKNITEYSIQDGATTIVNGAFFFCFSLTSITIPDSMTLIGDSAFNGCSGLKEVHISDIAAWCAIRFKTTSSNPLRYAKNLYLNNELVTNLVIPEGVTSIGDSAFYYCNSLTSVTIPESVTLIGNHAFDGCSSLTSITIPSSVSSIEYRAFEGCKGLTSMDFSKHDTPPTLSSSNAIPYANTDFVIYIKSGTLDTWQTATNWSDMSTYFQEKVLPTIITYTDRETTEVTVGDDGLLRQPLVRNAGDYTTIQSVEIGGDVTSIGSYAFYSCSGLRSVTIPESVTSIWDYAFSNCPDLTSVTIPSSVRSIGERAFYNCFGLTNIILEGRTLEEAQFLIRTTNIIGYTGTVTYDGGTYTTEGRGGMAGDDSGDGGS